MATLLYTEKPRRLILAPPSNRGAISLILESDLNQNCIVKFSSSRPAGLRPLPSPVVRGCIGIVAVNNGTIRLIKKYFSVSLQEAQGLQSLKDMKFTSSTELNFTVFLPTNMILGLQMWI